MIAAIIRARSEMLRAFFLAQKRQTRLTLSDVMTVWTAHRNSANNGPYHICKGGETQSKKSRVQAGKPTLD